ncbi:MAG: transglycosylase SLT domain-containing protein [Steroidobacteraceae bacterium]
MIRRLLPVRPPIFLNLFCLLALLLARGALADSPFEPPPALERDVQFWIRIYTEVSTDQGLLHDDRNLGVVYEKLGFDPDTSPRERGRLIDRRKEHYRALLARFAAGDTAGLDAEEQRIHDAFGESASPVVFRDAMDGVRFQLGQANRFREGLMRAGIWESHIARTLAQRGVPAEIAALPHVESSFNPGAWSKVGAAGLWQFMPSTARRYMRVDSLVDERMDPFTATEGAANLMLYNYRLLGSWPLAITAYNHGPGGLLKAQTDLGTNDIATIVRRYNGATFGFASRNFYVAFLAALEVDRNAEKYFGRIPKQPDAESTTVELPDYVPVHALTGAFKVDLGALKALNPALRPPIWDGARFVPRGYALRLPGTVEQPQIEAALARIPLNQRYLAQRSDVSYRSRRGDTPQGIAQRSGVSLDRLMAANGWSAAPSLRRGQVVRLPLPDTRAGRPAPVVVVAAAAAAPVAKPAATYTARTPGTPVAAPPGLEAGAGTAASAASTPVAPSADIASVFGDALPTASADPADYGLARDQTIIVQAEETLGHYADWSGININQLRAINHLKRGSPVSMGRKLKLPLAKAEVARFEDARRTYHRQLQDAYFASHRISGTESYAVKKGESLWTIQQSHPDIPAWLIRQYNPRVDFSELRPGSTLNLPRVAEANRE